MESGSFTAAPGLVLATPGFVWLLVAIGGAGIVRGFSGFGTALIFVPVANIFLEPIQVIALITLTGMASTAGLLPRAWRQGNRSEVGFLALAALLAVPVGLSFLEMLDDIAVRWLVAGIAGGTLAALIGGGRYSGNVSGSMLLLIGTIAGVVGGMTGLTGPVVILFYLAGHVAVQSVRANTILFLAALDVVILINLLFRGAIGWPIFFLALTLAVPYFTTTMIGQALFDPMHERLYRWITYGIVASAVLSGLPLWEQVV